MGWGNCQDQGQPVQWRPGSASGFVLTSRAREMLEVHPTLEGVLGHGLVRSHSRLQQSACSLCLCPCPECRELGTRVYIGVYQPHYRDTCISGLQAL